jgi:hypothetical protein
MAQYVAPLRHMLFILEELADLRGIERPPSCEETTFKVVGAI